MSIAKHDNDWEKYLIIRYRTDSQGVLNPTLNGGDFPFVPGLPVPMALVPPAGPFLVAEQEIAERSQFKRGLFTKTPPLKNLPS